MIGVAKNINVTQLAIEIQKQLMEYTEEVAETTRKIAMETSERTVKKLRENSPKSKGGGTYAKNWTRASETDGVVVYNRAPTYRLTHLLEKGHQLKQGGRKVGASPAYPHIEKIEQESVKEYLAEIERRI